MGKKRVKNRGKRVLIFVTLLIIGMVVLWVLTPTVSQYESEQASLIALDIPYTSDGDEIIEHTGFSLLYNEDHEQAQWVAYQLTRDHVYGNLPRKDNFREDPNISTGSAVLADYRGSGYDRGHLAPAGDLSYSEDSLSDSFYLSNMSPQEPSFNRGVWSRLEATVRNYAAHEGLVYVVTGPILTDGPYKTIGKNEVSVPNYYYKVILDYTEPEKKAIGFIVPNEGSKENLEVFATSVEEVEKLTGIDFFYQVPKEEQQILESSFDYSLWPNEEFRATKAEKEAYLENKEDFIPPPQGSLIYTVVKENVDKIMVMIKKEVNYLLGDLLGLLHSNFTKGAIVSVD